MWLVFVLLLLILLTGGWGVYGYTRGAVYAPFGGILGLILLIILIVILVRGGLP